MVRLSSCQDCEGGGDRRHESVSVGHQQPFVVASTYFMMNLSDVRGLPSSDSSDLAKRAAPTQWSIEMSRIASLVAYVAFVFLCCSVNAVRADVFIRGGNSMWSLKDDGHEPPADWITLGFDDSQWRQGNGPFGFGEAAVVTQVSPGGGEAAVRTTTYFRTAFDVRSPDAFTHLLLTICADDGYVAYRNGKELHRWNMPLGEVTPGLYATTWQSDPFEDLYQQFVLPSENLVTGCNVFAIEIHQGGDNSSDLYMDLALTGLSRASGGQARIRADAVMMTRHFNGGHSIGPDMRIPDGFVDGGRGMQLDEFGFVVSGRELLLVDRHNDDQLREHLRYAESQDLHALNEVDRATRIARYVDRVFTPPEGRRGCDIRTRQYLDQRYRSQEVLLGNVSLLCGAGVCRHRALLFKLMADQAGLKVALVRGNIGIDEQATNAHAWNELFLHDGKRVVVDVMNPKPDFYFPEVGDPSFRAYRTVANQPKYAFSEEPKGGPGAKGE